MFVIACELGGDTFYVPEKFEGDGSYPRTIEQARKFQSLVLAMDYMREHGYDQHEWTFWQVKTV